MFTHILLPSDGSELSAAAISHGLNLAKKLGARVTAFHARPPFHVFSTRTEMVEDTREQFERDAKLHAKEVLDGIAKRAAEAGVPCDTEAAVSDHPYEAIIAAALKNGCDLIVMASHGRRGVQALLLGSETQKVLTHSRIPVLVSR